ncbi:MAG: cofactor-independent phosphoglycerate mutase [Candidatus Omnitrophota bacterium]|nr:MAG: cofactor-independent phosphoglycerate mutase [Candidatus Omnitrophota bacterium]
MKYAVLVPDGMADYPIEELGGRTPLEVARTPNMDFIAKHGRLGRIKTVPDKMTPASDVANISILGYNPQVYYCGRGPLEAANLGVDLEDDDVAFRCNLITVLDDKLADYSAGHISSKEAEILIKFIDQKLGSKRFRFYPGVSYRHLMVAKAGARDNLQDVKCTPPHDIMGEKISKHFPKDGNAEILVELMENSRQVLETHEINTVRVDLKENPGNMIWLWGQGKKPSMPKFSERFGVDGAVISAVDLIKGLGLILGLDALKVDGATGYYDTDYLGKAKAALRVLEKKDFVFVHVEAPDEAGHNAHLREKITSIERFDHFIAGTILNAYKRKKNFRVLVLPDHATPISVRTHTRDIVPFGIFGKNVLGRGFVNFSEKEAENSKLLFEKGHELMRYFLNYKGG